MIPGFAAHFAVFIRGCYECCACLVNFVTVVVEGLCYCSASVVVMFVRIQDAMASAFVGIDSWRFMIMTVG